jgi:transposase
VTNTIHDGLESKGLTPREHLVDAGYTEADVLVESRNEHGIDVIGPMAADTSWQARAKSGYAASDFSIDWPKQVVRCPQGRQSCYWKEQESKSGRREIQVRFAARDCGACGVREQCSKAKGRPRILTLRSQEPFEAMQAARRRQETDEFKAVYAERSGCESTMSQAVRGYGLRRSRYRGLAKTHLQCILTAVAMTLVRVIDWLADPFVAPKRRSAFAALTPV